nr:hypothetical protein [Chitinophagaceae bacterium]
SIGNKGYLGLGLSASNILNDFWEYDPVENTWTQKANFTGGIRFYSLGFSIGNKGYFGTGYIGAPPLRKDFWEYDPASNQWTRKQDFGGIGRARATGFSIGSKGYIGLGTIGTSNLKDFWEYNPDTDQWTQKQDFGGTERNGAAGFAIGSKGYIGVGTNNGTYLNDFWEYNPANDGWVKKQDFGGPPRYAAAGFVIQGKGYIGTGMDNSYFNDFWEYDPQNNLWAQKANVGTTGRSSAVAFSIGDRGYIVTGNVMGLASNDFWEYNPYPLKSSFSPSPAVVNALQYNDGSWTRKADSLFTTSLQTRVGIGTASPTARLEVNGTTKTTGLQITTAAAAGFLLQSDAAGNAGWVNPASLTIAETDPEVGSNTLNYLSKWNGSALISSAVIENTGNVGIGIVPGRRLDVSGTGGLRVSSTNAGTGITDWIAGNFGGTTGHRVVMGLLNGIATIGAHNNALNAWTNLSINPGPGNVGIGTLTAVNKLDVQGGIAIGSGYAGTYAAPSNGAIIQGNVVIGNSVSETSATLEVFGTAKIGKSGTTLSGIVKRTYGLPAGSFTANSSSSYTFAFAGATTGGSVMVSPSSALPAGMVIAYGWVSATNSVNVVLRNTTGANIAYPGGIDLHITVVTD